MLGGKHLLSLIFGAVEPDVITPKPISGSPALSIPLAIYNAGAALFRSMSNSRVSMMTSIAMNLVNISGNAILIYVFNMGVAGAVACLSGLPHPGRCRHDGAAALTGTTSSLSGISSRYRFDWPMVRSILHIGVPNGLENGMFQVGRCWISSLIAVFGTSAITANAIANNLAQFSVPGSAMGLCNDYRHRPLRRRQDYKQARYYAKRLMIITLHQHDRDLYPALGADRAPSSALHPSQETFDLSVWLGLYMARAAF